MAVCKSSLALAASLPGLTADVVEIEDLTWRAVRVGGNTISTDFVLITASSLRTGRITKVTVIRGAREAKPRSEARWTGYVENGTTLAGRMVADTIYAGLVIGTACSCWAVRFWKKTVGTRGAFEWKLRTIHRIDARRSGWIENIARSGAVS